MAELLFSDINFIRDIPQCIYSKLAPFQNKIDSLLEIPLDFPHGELHIAETRSIARQIGEVDELGFDILEKIDQEVYLHDAGYVFCKLGILALDEHHFGSAFIAKQLGLDNEQIGGILNHTMYDLNKAPGLFRSNSFNSVLQCADRLSGCGWSGAIRQAYYVGFRHPFFENQFVNQKYLVDLRKISDLDHYRQYVGDHGFYEVVPGYEADVKRFFMKEILPQLDFLTRGRLQNKLILANKQILGGKNILPITYTALDMFTQKIINTEEAIKMLE